MQIVSQPCHALVLDWLRTGAIGELTEIDVQEKQKGGPCGRRGAGSNSNDCERVRGHNVVTETPQCSREDLRDVGEDEDLGG